MREFVETEKFGKLYIDKILFETNIPIVFTCINDMEEIFLVICSQSNSKGCKWLAGKVRTQDIVDFLQDKLTAREILLDKSEGKISIDYTENKYKISYANSDWNKDSVFLPKEDSYMYADEGEFKEEIAYFKAFSKVNYSAKYESVALALDNLGNGIEPLFSIFDLYASVLRNKQILNGLSVIPPIYSRLKRDNIRIGKNNKCESTSYESTSYKAISGNSLNIDESLDFTLQIDPDSINAA